MKILWNIKLVFVFIGVLPFFLKALFYCLPERFFYLCDLTIWFSRFILSFWVCFKDSELSDIFDWTAKFLILSGSLFELAEAKLQLRTNQKRDVSSRNRAILCFLGNKKSGRVCISVPLTLLLCNLEKKPLCQTLWKA